MRRSVRRSFPSSREGALRLLCGKLTVAPRVHPQSFSLVLAGHADPFIFMADVMRLNVVEAQVIIQNDNFHTDDNSNSTLSTKESSLLESGKWAWEGSGEKLREYTGAKESAQITNQLSPTETTAESSCCESDSDEEKPQLVRKSFSNPNYPGFQHLAHELNDTYNNNGGADANDNDIKGIDSVNKLDLKEGPKRIYCRPKLNIPIEVKKVNYEMETTARKAPAKDTMTKDNKTIETEKGVGDTRKREKNVQKKPTKGQDKGSFDVYNIETAMPKIDLAAIESHLKAAKEEEQRRRNDREEIRRRLATGCDTDEFYGRDKPGRKPSLQSRLQSGMNLQICFMNETSSDTESPSSESASPSKPNSTAPLSSIKPKTPPEPPKTLNLIKCGDPKVSQQNGSGGDDKTFYTTQARLQAEARLALSQAKDRARLQMEADRLSGKTSPITEMLRASLKKVGVFFPPERRRVSRQMLTDMNVAQLQVIVNDLHTQIENLNEGLVKFLMERDELHMTQDSMLVDIEDITRYLGAKESTLEEDVVRNNNLAPPSKPVITRIVSLGKK